MTRNQTEEDRKVQRDQALLRDKDTRTPDLEDELVTESDPAVDLESAYGVERDENAKDAEDFCGSD
jgi:hypothetical protein